MALDTWQRPPHLIGSSLIVHTFSTPAAERQTRLVSPPALFIVNFSSALPHAETEAKLMKAALMERKRLQPGETSYDRVSPSPLALACVTSPVSPGVGMPPN